MDELKIIVWIIIGLVYLFARGKKKQKQQQTVSRPAPTDQEYAEPSPAKPMTFEDLLREIEGSKQKESSPEVVEKPLYQEPVKPTWQPYAYDDEVVIEKKQKPLEDTNYDYRKHDKIYDEYDNAKKYAFVKPSLEETMKLEDTVVRFNQFKEYEQAPKNHLREEILKDIKNPKSFKKAFIISEILNRRF